mmetsp:Transcript_30158/g.86361  ORF Transcript_30158/g.86361 Transcript_30158/m.86361 type:complete len:345 (+) Transcript_30158:92-1126(+)
MAADDGATGPMWVGGSLAGGAAADAATGGASWSFDVADEAGWLAHLREEGFVVIRRCAEVAEVEAGRSLFWDALEKVTPARRDDLATWGGWRLDQRGFSINGNVTQGEGAWMIRSLPRVRQVFERIWEESDLICSMDLLLVWKPWWLGPSVGVPLARWRPKTEGLHVDQNPLFKPDFACVQGMVPLYDVTAETGGLEVVPRSHGPEARALLLERCGESLRSLGDFCTLPGDAFPAGASIVVAAGAGDLILWDSRTVHGGRVGTGEGEGEGLPVASGSTPQLARMALPVCMTPRRLASVEVLKARRDMFETGQPTNHWPHQPRSQCKVCFNYEPITLTLTQEALL